MLCCLFGSTFTLHSVKESAVTEPPKATGVSDGGIIALGVVFGTFAVAMGTFIAYLIYREKKGKPSFGPQVRIFTFSLFQLCFNFSFNKDFDLCGPQPPPS